MHLLDNKVFVIDAQCKSEEFFFKFNPFYGLLSAPLLCLEWPFKLGLQIF